MPHHLAVGGQRQGDQPADDGERRDTQQHLPRPPAAQRLPGGLHQARAEPRQAEDRGDGQAEQERDQGGRAQRGGERLGTGQLGRREAAGGIDPGRPAGRLG
jgi:hypothetical protein